jgi:hypothetical protein
MQGIGTTSRGSRFTCAFLIFIGETLYLNQENRYITFYDFLKTDSQGGIMTTVAVRSTTFFRPVTPSYVLAPASLDKEGRASILERVAILGQVRFCNADIAHTTITFNEGVAGRYERAHSPASEGIIHVEIPIRRKKLVSVRDITETSLLTGVTTSYQEEVYKDVFEKREFKLHNVYKGTYLIAQDKETALVFLLKQPSSHRVSPYCCGRQFRSPSASFLSSSGGLGL